MAPAITSSVAPLSLITARATILSRRSPRTRHSVPATMLAVVRLPDPATSTAAEQQTTSKPVEEAAAAASREVSADEAATTAAECAAASTPTTATRT